MGKHEYRLQLREFSKVDSQRKRQARRKKLDKIKHLIEQALKKATKSQKKTAKKAIKKASKKARAKKVSKKPRRSITPKTNIIKEILKTKKYTSAELAALLKSKFPKQWVTTNVVNQWAKTGNNPPTIMLKTLQKLHKEASLKRRKIRRKRR